MLLLDERILADGRHVRTWLRVAGDRVEIHDDDGGRGALSIGALARVMSRYGRPLDPGVVLGEPPLELPGGYRLRRLRYHAAVDATGRDYLVWEQPPDQHGAAPELLCVVATMATAALRYLVLRLDAERPQESEA